MSGERRDDGTCWTCAKPRCLSWFGHMLGRLGYACRMARHGKPKTLGARLRLLGSDFVIHGLLNRGGERCQDCGRRYPLWHADDMEWERVAGCAAGLLCPNCFLRRGGVAAYALAVRHDVEAGR